MGSEMCIRDSSLFVGTVAGFLASAVLLALARIPRTEAPPVTPFLDRLTQGTRLFWARRELRGLLGLNLVVAAATAMVIINTVVLVQGALARPQTDVALLLGAYGGGSMVVALAVPRLLAHRTDRTVMMTGAAALPLLLAGFAAVLLWAEGAPQWVLLLVLWFLAGAATSAVLTPSARLLRRNSTEDQRPAVFAAQFSLSLSLIHI